MKCERAFCSVGSLACVVRPNYLGPRRRLLVCHLCGGKVCKNCSSLAKMAHTYKCSPTNRRRFILYVTVRLCNTCAGMYISTAPCCSATT